MRLLGYDERELIICKVEKHYPFTVIYIVIALPCKVVHVIHSS